jgi:hypothetical protein
VTGETDPPASHDAGTDQVSIHAADRVDTAMYLLSHRRRRDALRYLRGRDGPATIGELVGHVAALEARRRGESPVVLRRVVRTDLLDEHLPRLEAAGVVDRVARGLRYDAPPAVDSLLTALSAVEGDARDR